MLGWLKRRLAPATGPDFGHVDSLRKAEQLHARGELHKLLLLPAEFGGEDIPANVVYVPPFAVTVKQGIDLNTIMPLVEEGRVSRYTATPQYEGKSVVPSAILISASDPGSYTGTVAIWGQALQQHALDVIQDLHARLPVLTLGTQPLDALGPEAFVRAFIDDYAAWNRYANELADRPNRMDAAEEAYLMLIHKFCLPGHQHQSIAFGSRSRHDNAYETIVGIEAVQEGCIVATRHQADDSDFVSDFEYHLKRADGRWFLAEVYYVDEDGKYESL